MSGPSRSVFNDDDVASSFSTPSLVSTSDFSSNSIQDSAVELLLPTGPNAHGCTYGTAVSTATPDGTNTEPYSKERRYCYFISKKASTIIELLGLSLAVFIVIGCFSTPVVYRFVR